MSLPDLVNGVFEGIGGFFIALSVIKLHRAKVVSGVSAVHVAFFSSWGFWNLFYYPHLDQWLSFWGGVLLVAVNCVWLAQIFYYNHLFRHPEARGDEFWHPDLKAAENVMVDDQFGGFNRTTSRYRHADK